MTLTAAQLAPALSGQAPPAADAQALRTTSVHLQDAARRCEQSAQRLRRDIAPLARLWRGAAAQTAWQAITDLLAAAARTASSHDVAAHALLGCAGQVEEARAVWRRAESLERLDLEQRAERERAAAGGTFVVPYDVDGSPLRRQARRLAQEAHAVADDACARAAAQLRELTESDEARLSAGQQLAAVGPAAFAAVRDSVALFASLSPPRMLIDREGWLEDVGGLRDGAAYAADHPREAGLAAVGWDLLADGRYGEWAGGLVPDLLSGVLSGGVVPASRRMTDVADDLKDLAEDVEELERLEGRSVVLREPVAGGPVHPREGAPMTPRYPAVIGVLTPERQRHILDGDPPPSTGGGHRAGTGRPGKSEFPASWSDDDIIRRVMETARHPERTRGQQKNDNLRARATYDGVLVEVIVNPHGSIVTAYPVRGPGVVKNPTFLGEAAAS